MLKIKGDNSTQVHSDGFFKSQVTFTKNGQSVQITKRWALTAAILTLFGYQYIAYKDGTKIYHISMNELKDKSPEKKITQANCQDVFNSVFTVQNKNFLKELLNAKEKSPDLIKTQLDKLPDLNLFEKAQNDDTFFDLALKSGIKTIIDAFVSRIPEGTLFTYTDTPLLKHIDPSVPMYMIKDFLARTSHSFTEGSKPIHVTVLEKIKENLGSSNTPNAKYYLTILALLIQDKGFNPHTVIDGTPPINLATLIHNTLHTQGDQDTQAQLTYSINDTQYGVLDFLKERLGSAGVNYDAKMKEESH
jgi:hypothetical protein